MCNLTSEPYEYIKGCGYYLSVQIPFILNEMSMEQFLKENPSFDKTHPYFWLNPKTQQYESFPDKQSLCEALTQAHMSHLPPLYRQIKSDPHRK